MKIVLDTNVVLGALIKPNGLASLLVRALDKERLVNYTSEEALAELSLKIALLRDRERLSPGWERVLAHYLAMSEVASPMHGFHFCRDHDDDKWLEIAFEVRASHIITWDKDLLDLRDEDKSLSLEGHTLKILTPVEFYHEAIKREC